MCATDNTNHWYTEFWNNIIFDNIMFVGISVVLTGPLKLIYLIFILINPTSVDVKPGLIRNNHRQQNVTWYHKGQREFY